MTDPANVPHVDEDRLDEVYAALTDSYRRCVLCYFLEGPDDVASIDALAAHVAESDDADRERVAIELHHLHLPKLEDAGIVEYDTRSRTVRYRGDPLVSQQYRLLTASERGE